VVGWRPLLSCSVPRRPKTVARMRMGRATLTLVGLLLAAPGPARAADDWRDRVTLTLSERLRGELIDWFQPRAAPRGAGRYGFFASRLRAGITVTLPHVQLVLQRQDHPPRQPPRRRRLPAACRPSRPGGALLPPHPPDDAARALLKPGFVTLRRSGLSLTALSNDRTARFARSRPRSPSGRRLPRAAAAGSRAGRRRRPAPRRARPSRRARARARGCR
jgi:hypothetical protein